MIRYIIQGNEPILAFAGILFAFACTCLFTSECARFLPKDAGRAFAHDGKLSEGKPRGAGIIFTLVFVAASVLFIRPSAELSIYLLLVVVEMMTGFLDDAAEKPWGELKKGLLDFLVAAVAAVTYFNFNSSCIEIATLGIEVTLPPLVFILLAIILVWTSINVTNCSDGVDGLSGTLTIITLVTIYVMIEVKKLEGTEDFSFMILLFAVCILGYLWYNATPSRLMMGDAGSRTMGLFIAVAILKTGSPFLYIPVAFVLILDGGLGLLKVSLIRAFHIHIMKNTLTPLHDHVRKNKGWSNTQTVYRFAIIQIILCVAVVYLIM